MSEVKRPARPARWISGFSALLLVLTIAIVLISSGRAWVLGGAALGLVAAWLISTLIPLRRRSPVVALTLLVVIVAAAVAGWAALKRPAPQSRDQTAPPPAMVVRYLAAGQLDGTTLVLSETVVIDALDRAMSLIVVPREGSDPTDWRSGPAVDGFPSLVRTRTVRLNDTTLAGVTLTFPLDLGELPLPSGPVRLGIRDGSLITLTGPADAFGTTTPPSTGIESTDDGHEETTISVGGDVTDVAVVVLAEPFRSPVGHLFYDVVTWGPLPWLIGAFVALFGSVLWDRILGLVIRSGRRSRADHPTPASG